MDNYQNTNQNKEEDQEYPPEQGNDIAQGLMWGLIICIVIATMVFGIVVITRDESEEQVAEYPLSIQLELVDVGRMSIQDQIRYYSYLEKFKDADLLIELAFCESSFRQFVLGDNGHSRGIFQIHNLYHPEISDECAFDIKCSTEFVINTINRDRHRSEWFNCMKKIENR